MRTTWSATCASGAGSHSSSARCRLSPPVDGTVAPALRCAWRRGDRRRGDPCVPTPGGPHSHPVTGEVRELPVRHDVNMDKSLSSQRWLARLSFTLAGLAIVVLAVFGGLKSLAMLAVAVAAAVVSLAAAYIFLARRGVWRWLALAVFVLVPIAVIVVYASHHLLWIAIVSAALWLLASITARQALTSDQADWRMPEYPAQPPARRPYLIMNPRSGGGKVEKFDLKRKAEA